MATFTGTAGADTITGSTDSDVISGGAGNDKIKAGLGADTVHGDDGNDAIIGEAGDDTLYGDLGDDTLTGDAGRDTLYGGEGNDGFFGGGDDDLIFGGNGNDTIFGDGANDTIDGGMGADKLNGGTGNDKFIVTAGEGGDVITGGSGIDTVELRISSANVTAAFRADIAAYQNYMSQQLATAGSLAALSAQTTGNSFTFASLGTTITGTESLTVMLDGQLVPLQTFLNTAPVAVTDQVAVSEDTFVSGNVLANDSDADGNALSVTGYSVAGISGTVAAGTETVIQSVGSLTINGDGSYSFTPAANYSGAVPVATYTITDGQGASASADLVLGPIVAVADLAALTVSDVNAGSTGIILNGTNASETLKGTAGDDTISGGAGDDVIYGNGGPAQTRTVALDISAALTDMDGSEQLSIKIEGVPAAAVLSAGSQGTDGVWTLTAAQLAGLTMTTPVASDLALTVTATSTESSGQSAATSGVVHVTFDRGTDSDRLDGGAGNDKIYGGAGNNTLLDGDGNDFVYGNSGNDTFIAGNGLDTYDGGAGFDILDMSNAAAGVVVDLGKQTAIGLGADKVLNFEGVIGTGQDDVLTGSKYDSSLWGRDGNDKLFGGAGNDTIDGGNGSDTLEGGAGNDVISDGLGNDIVNSGSGDDWIIAGDGDDTYIGGSGFDVLDYSAATRAISVDASKKVISGYSNDKVDGIEKYIGTNYADNFKGGSSANSFDGGAGNDVFRGMGGTDIYTGGSGDDRFNWFVKDIVKGAKTLGADVITDFGDGNDVLNLREFTKAYTALDINDVIHINDTSNGSMVSVKTSQGFVDLVMLQGVHDLSVNALIADGDILI